LVKSWPLVAASFTAACSSVVASHERYPAHITPNGVVHEFVSTALRSGGKSSIQCGRLHAAASNAYGDSGNYAAAESADARSSRQVGHYCSDQCGWLHAAAGSAYGD
jgi:hypothetical protein